MIILHVVLAISSLVFASINYFRPGKGKMQASYGLAAGTLISGVSLILLNNASVLRTCLSGIIFFAAVSALNIAASRKLALQSTKE